MPRISKNHLCRPLLLLCMLTAWPLNARAQAEGVQAAREHPVWNEILQGLTAEARSSQGQSLTALGDSAFPGSLKLLQAIKAGQGRVDSTGQFLLQTEAGITLQRLSADGKLTNASATEPTHKFVITNALRRTLSTAIAQQQLRAEDQGERLAAATVLSKSPPEELVPAMRAALKREDVPQIMAMLTLGLAQADLASTDSKRRLSALRTIADSGEQSFLPQLKALLTKDSGDNYLEQNAQVRAAAQETLRSLERQAFFGRIVRDLFYGASLGSVLLLAALGLAITFGLMGVINMAHGELLMLGAYATYLTQEFFVQYLPGAVDFYLLAAIPVSFVLTMAMGMLIERVVLRKLYGRPLETLLATFGISLLLIQLVRSTFGAANVSVANPSYLTGGYTLLPGLVLPYARIAIVGFVIAVVAFVWYLLNRTALGLQVRVTTQNRAMAACVGMRTQHIDMLTFGLGSGVAGLGGVALSQIGNVGPELGQGYIVDSFMVVVVGGVGKLVGTVVTSLGLGVINKVLEPVSGAVLAKILVLAFVILFIQRRPQGLFALKGRSVEH